MKIRMRIDVFQHLTDDLTDHLDSDQIYPFPLPQTRDAPSHDPLSSIISLFTSSAAPAGNMTTSPAGDMSTPHDHLPY